ncbi:MAG: 16S rRNA (adenine(1518)-N(6)/adenine(1519)-N(6))-dimethyltransferase RsmA [Candidatus Hadarchaeota archaeon]|nr:16S rRNA (adenine(1518)-N(6)/adenine(1519)-N(6))-dimethyltransferase RsmA [Candidatus Hadarchaeota archaeon]
MLRDKTRAILRRYGVRLSKRRGQPHVIDGGLLRRMVNYAEISRGDVVFEIGAGTGNLTAMLVQRAGKVVAVESDARLVQALRARLGKYPNLEILHGDVLKLELPRFNKVAANLPYAISSDVTFKLLTSGFKLAVLMYQHEFAQRLVASSGTKEYGRLTVNVYYRAEVELLEEVPSEAFMPRPKVKSTVVRLRPREPPFRVQDERLFADVVRAVFQHRRKRVCNALFHSFEEIFPTTGLTKKEKHEWVKRTLSGKHANARAADLSPEELGKIANSFTTFRSDLQA